LRLVGSLGHFERYPRLLRERAHCVGHKARGGWSVLKAISDASPKPPSASVSFKCNIGAKKGKRSVEKPLIPIARVVAKTAEEIEKVGRGKLVDIRYLHGNKAKKSARRRKRILCNTTNVIICFHRERGEVNRRPWGVYS